MTDPVAPGFAVTGVPGVPEIRAGDDLAAVLVDALGASGQHLADGDVVVVTSKIVSKAEGRVRRGVERDEAIDDEARRTVAEWSTPRGRTRVVETRHGLVLAAAGVDASNVEPGSLVLLPLDPDASARRLRAGLADRLGVRVGVVVTDTAGRVWRNGVVDLAVGAAGVATTDDLRGRTDPYGNDLGVTVVAVADELAAATELVRTKLAGMPVAVVRGLAHLVLPDGADDPGAAALVRPAAEDRFRLGTPEAMRAAVLARRAVRSFAPRPVEPSVLGPALAAAHDDAGRWHVTRLAPDQRARVAKLPGAEVPEAAEVLVVIAAGPDPAHWLDLGAAIERLAVVLVADGVAISWRAADDRLRAAVAEALGDAALGHGGSVLAGLITAGYPAEGDAVVT